MNNQTSGRVVGNWKAPQSVIRRHDGQASAHTTTLMRGHVLVIVSLAVTSLVRRAKRWRRQLQFWASVGIWNDAWQGLLNSVFKGRAMTIHFTSLDLCSYWFSRISAQPWLLVETLLMLATVPRWLTFLQSWWRKTYKIFSLPLHPRLHPNALASER